MAENRVESSGDEFAVAAAVIMAGIANNPTRDSALDPLGLGPNADTAELGWPCLCCCKFGE